MLTKFQQLFCINDTITKTENNQLITLIQRTKKLNNLTERLN